MRRWANLSWRHRFLIAVSLMVVGVIGAASWLILSLGRMSDDVNGFQRVSLPGRATLQLAARKYVIYYEFGSAGRRGSSYEFQIQDARTGATLETPPYGGSLTYSLDHNGSAQATVTPPHAGAYTLTTSVDGPANGARLALGRSIAGAIVVAVLETLAIIGLLGGSGVILLVMTIVRRRRARRTAGVNAPSTPFAS